MQMFCMLRLEASSHDLVWQKGWRGDSSLDLHKASDPARQDVWGEAMVGSMSYLGGSGKALGGLKRWPVPSLGLPHPKLTYMHLTTCGFDVWAKAGSFHVHFM